jgi:MFS transporter, OFA family, oxalate/formate antiporter
VAGAAFAANMVTFGILFSFGVFLDPFMEEFDSSEGPVAAVFSAAVLLYYAGGAIGGRLGDRFSVRPVVTFGAVAMTVGLALSSRAGEVWHLYFLYAPLVGVAVGSCYPPMIGVVGRWFVRWRAMAIATVLTGVALGTSLGPIASEALIEAHGWRTALLVFALVSAVVLGTAALVSGGPPTDEAAASVSVKVLVRSRRFRRLYLALMLVSPGFYMPLVFLKNYAEEEGVGSGNAALLLGLIGAASAVSRPIIGTFRDRFDGLSQYRLSYVMMLSGLVVWLFADGSYLALMVMAVIHGVGWAMWVTAAPAVLADWFGVRDLGGVLGAFYTGLGLGALAGPAVSGVIVERAGYDAAIGLVVASTVTALVVSLLPMDDSSTAEM